MALLFTIDNGTTTGQTIQRRSVGALEIGNIARGIIDGRPISGEPVRIVDVVRTKHRSRRKVPMMSVTFTTEHGAGSVILPANAPVSVETND